ncbi:MAG TPA: hypothetical protein VFF78_05780 [Anaerolineaceae bacterium]|nr:hypothetical protein [Anaerolineaceae bacterium]
MNRNIVGRVIAGLVLLAVLVGIGAFAYHAGTVNGLAQAAPVEAGQAPAPYYGYGMRGMHGFGFGPFGFLIGLFLFFLAFGALRRLIWGRRMMHGPWMHGPWGNGGMPPQGVPPFFAEWHRQAHAEKEPQTNPDENK